MILFVFKKKIGMYGDDNNYVVCFTEVITAMLFQLQVHSHVIIVSQCWYRHVDYGWSKQ